MCLSTLFFFFGNVLLSNTIDLGSNSLGPVGSRKMSKEYISERNINFNKNELTFQENLCDMGFGNKSMY